MGVKGGCSPQNNRRKPLRLLNELPAAGNKILYENFHIFRPAAGRGKTTDDLEEINDIAWPGEAIGGAKLPARSGCAGARRGL
jgi:hypothetical protein